MLRIRDVYPGSRILILPILDPGSRIPDPKAATKEGSEKKLVIILFLAVTNFTKLNIILFSKCWRKTFGPIFKELLKFFPKNFSLCCQIYGFGIRDPRSGKNLSRSRDKKDTGSRIRNTAVLRIRDYHSVSDFFHSGLTRSRARIKKFKVILTQKIDTSSQKYNPGCSPRILSMDFFHPRCRGQKSTGSRIRNTVIPCNIHEAKFSMFIRLRLSHEIQ